MVDLKFGLQKCLVYHKRAVGRAILSLLVFFHILKYNIIFVGNLAQKIMTYFAKFSKLL